MNPEYFANFSMRVFNDSNGVSRLNASGVLLVDLTQYVAHLSVMHRTKGNAEYSKLSFKGCVDLCRVQKGVLVNYVIKYLAQELDQFSNYRFQCPMVKGFYFAADFPAPGISSLSIFTLKNKDRSPEFEFTAVVKAKRDSKKKGSEHVLTLRVNGKTVLWMLSQNVCSSVVSFEGFLGLI